MKLAGSKGGGQAAAPPLLSGGEDMLPHNMPKKKYTQVKVWKKQKATSGNNSKAKHKVPQKGQFNPPPKTMVVDGRRGSARMVKT